MIAELMVAAALSSQGFESPVVAPWSLYPPPVFHPIYEAPEGHVVTWSDQQHHTLSRKLTREVNFKPGDWNGLNGRYCQGQLDCGTLNGGFITQGMLETEIGSVTTAQAWDALHRDYGVKANDPWLYQMEYDWCIEHCVGMACFDPGAQEAAFK